MNIVEKLKWAAAVIIVGVLVSLTSSCVAPNAASRPAPRVAAATVKRVYEHEDDVYRYKLTKVCYTDGFCSSQLTVICKTKDRIWGCRDFAISDLNRDGDWESITVSVGDKSYQFDLFHGMVTRSNSGHMPNLVNQVQAILVPHASSAVEEIPLRVKPSQVIKI